MPVICSSHRFLPSLPQFLFSLVVIIGCASLFPCSLSLDAQYEYCKSNSKCGTFNIGYPFGVGNRGCGLPNFQLDCVQKSSFVISIRGRTYTVLASVSSTILVIIRGQNCHFLNHSNNNAIPSSEFAGTFFTFKATETLTLYAYRCNIQDQSDPLKCNASVYYSLYENKNFAPACSAGQVIVNALVIQSVPRNEVCKSCEASHGICGYNTSDSTPTARFVCYCNEGPRTDKCPGHGCFVGGAALIVVVYYLYYVKNVKPTPHGRHPRILPRCEMGNLPIFSYEALRRTTNCFHRENELGVGGFGSVYLGKLYDGRPVAIKRLYQDNSRSVEQFINEVKIFSTLNHPHVVRLYGCTPPDSPELLLVYEYIPNGTLAEHLHGDRKSPKGLPWNTRLKIVIQTAEALAFLHALSPPVLHRDVKSSNILLDEKLDIKLADFGLCRVLPVTASHVTTSPQGTPGYVDPDYHLCYQMTEKSDVYSFGVVLMEIISGKLAMDINRNRRDINLANFAITKIQEGALHELVDPRLEIEVNPEVEVMVSAVSELAFRCLASERDDRPDMQNVVAQLQQIRHSCGTSTGQRPQ
eukprot:PITA_25338